MIREHKVSAYIKLRSMVDRGDRRSKQASRLLAAWESLSEAERAEVTRRTKLQGARIL